MGHFVYFTVILAVSCNVGLSQPGRDCDSPGSFNCADGCVSDCVPPQWLCDTEPDCDDGSDEVGCPTNCSHVNSFLCQNGNCVPDQHRCDGGDDCGDNSDEQDCQFETATGSTTVDCDSPGSFNCADGSVPGCVPPQWLCDTEPDCDDGSDELGCPSNCSHVNTFLCKNDVCITKVYECDGEDDCGDNSDEELCGSSTEEPTTTKPKSGKLPPHWSGWLSGLYDLSSLGRMWSAITVERADDGLIHAEVKQNKQRP